MFDSANGDFDIQKNHINGLGNYVITSGLTDNGILGKTDISAKIFDKNTITIDMFGNTFFRSFQYKIVTHARVFSVKSKVGISEKQGLFLANSFHFLSKKFGYDNMCSWVKIKSEYIQLPTKNKKIDFDFMETFITELEKERISKLDVYLEASGLKDYNLTVEEQKVLDDFENINWGTHKINKLFNKLNLKNHNKSFEKILDTSTTKTPEFNLPLVNAKLGNNGIMFYGREKDFDSSEMTIDVISNGAVATGTVYAQPYKTGVLWDAYLLKPTVENISKKNLLYMATSLQKSIKTKFGWEDKAVWSKVQHENMSLPINNKEPDYKTMETLISAIQKQVIKDVVLYTDKKLNVAK